MGRLDRQERHLDGNQRVARLRIILRFCVAAALACSFAEEAYLCGGRGRRSIPDGDYDIGLGFFALDLAGCGISSLYNNARIFP